VTGATGPTGPSGPTNYTAPTTTVAAIASFLEATNNGTNKVDLTSAAALAADATVQLPSTTGTLLSTAETQTITKGFTVTPNNIGTVSSGTTTLDPANGNYQYYTNNGAHTLAAPTSDCAIDILVTNGASAGSITFSGFTVGSGTGSTYNTTNTNKFILSVRRINAVSTYSWYALQ
jgi:hypothetical protein